MYTCSHDDLSVYIIWIQPILVNNVRLGPNPSRVRLSALREWYFSIGAMHGGFRRGVYGMHGRVPWRGYVHLIPVYSGDRPGLPS